MSNDPKTLIIEQLKKLYFAELETVMNYLANSVYLDGIKAMEIKASLQADIQEELTHAQQLAQRIKILGGRIPASQEFKATQSSLQTPPKTTDILHVIKGVLDAEQDAMSGYRNLIKLTSGHDPVTEDMAITILAEEEAHFREFQSFLAEYQDITPGIQL